MTQTASYTLEAFVHDLQDIFSRPDTLPSLPNAVAEVVQRLLVNGGWIQEKLDQGGYDALPGSVYSDSQYGYPGPGFHITCGAETPGMYRAPHDHGAAFVVYGIFKGAVHQVRWGWEHPNSPLEPQLAQQSDWVQQAGQVAYFMPGEIHSTHNVDDTDGRSIIVRVESQNLKKVERHSYSADENAASLMKANG